MSSPKYKTRGRSYLICPELIKLDERFKDHQHNLKFKDLPDAELHTFHIHLWVPGCRPMKESEHPICDKCGKKLVVADLDDPYDPKHLEE